MQKSRAFSLLILLGLVISGCSKLTLVRHRADYHSTLRQHNSVLVLPSVAEVSTVDIANNKERMYDYETHLEEIIHRKIIPSIHAKGFKVKVLRKRDIKGKELANHFMHLRQIYNNTREDLYAQHFWEEEKAHNLQKNLGAPAIALGKLTQSDLLVLVDYVATSKTSGARALNFVGAIAMSALGGRGELDPAEQGVMIVGIVETKTGNLLWMNMHSYAQDVISSSFSSSSAGDEIDKKRVNDLIEGVLAALSGKNQVVAPS